MCVHNEFAYFFFNLDVELQVTLSPDVDNEDKGNDNVCTNSIFIIYGIYIMDAFHDINMDKGL